MNNKTGAIITCCLLTSFLLSAEALAENAARDFQSELVTKTTFIAFDVETTGLSPKKDRVVELGLVKFKNGRIKEKRCWLINPDRPIPVYATKVHGITDEMVADKPRFEDICSDLMAFIGDDILIAHNARFDVNFVSAEIKRMKGTLPDNEVLDSLKLFRAWFPELDSHKLSIVAKHVGSRKGTFHRALDDSIFLKNIFKNAINKQVTPLIVYDLFELNGGSIMFKDIEIVPLVASLN